jgi:hypothetical protein
VHLDGDFSGNLPVNAFVLVDGVSDGVVVISKWGKFALHNARVAVLLDVPAFCQINFARDIIHRKRKLSGAFICPHVHAVELV